MVLVGCALTKNAWEVDWPSLITKMVNRSSAGAVVLTGMPQKLTVEGEVSNRARTASTIVIFVLLNNLAPLNCNQTIKVKR